MFAIENKYAIPNLSLYDMENILCTSTLLYCCRNTAYIFASPPTPNLREHFRQQHVCKNGEYTLFVSLACIWYIEFKNADIYSCFNSLDNLTTNSNKNV